MGEREFRRESLDSPKGLILGLALLSLERGTPAASMSLWGRGGSGQDVPAPERDVPGSIGRAPSDEGLFQTARHPPHQLHVCLSYAHLGLT